MSEDIEILRLRAKAKAKRDAEAGQEAEPVEQAPEPVEQEFGRTEEGFNLLSPVGLVGAAASKLFGTENVGRVVESGAESVAGGLASVAKELGGSTVGGIVSAGTQALEDAINPNVDVSIENMYEAYNKSRNQIDEEMNKAISDAPISSFAASVGTNIALMRMFNIPTEISAKGKMFNQKNVAAMQEMAKFNAAHGFLTADNDDNRFIESAYRVGGGVAFDALGIATFSKWNQIRSAAKSSVREFADETALDVLTPSQSGKIIKKLKSVVKRSYGGNQEAAAMDFREISGVKGAETISDMADNISMNREIIGSKIAKIIDSAEELATPDKVVDGISIRNKIVSQLGSVSSRAMREKRNLTPALRAPFEAIDELADDITVQSIKEGGISTTQKEILKEVISPDGHKIKVPEVLTLSNKAPDVKEFKQFTPAALFDTKVRIAHSVESFFEKKLVNAKLTNADKVWLDKQKANIVGMLTEEVDNVLSKVTSDELKGVVSLSDFQKLNRQYSLATAMEDAARTSADIKWESSAFKIGSTAMTFKGFFLAGLGGMAGGGAGLASGLALNFMLKSPKTPAKAVRGLNKLADHIKINPNGNLSERFRALFASTDSPEVFERGVSALVAEVNLIDNAIARDSDDVMAKGNSIAAIVRNNIGDEQADQILDILSRGNPDEIGAFMDGISKHPEASQFFEDGIGFNGKVYSDEDVAQLLEEIESSDVSRLQKSKLKKQLRDTKQIPQMQQEPERFIKYQTRDKTKPSF